MKNVIWFENINKIGGVESVIWNLVRKYKDYDITIWYDRADDMQLYRLSKYTNLLKFSEDQHIECDNLIINYGYEKIEGHYTAKSVKFIIHANYEYLLNKCAVKRIVTDPNFEYYAVSKFAADKYEKVSGIKPKVIYNPITIDDNRNAILIVSATRISADKGDQCERMVTLANRLTERNIPFIWLVFTTSSEKLGNPNIINVPSRLDILPYLKKADFVAQLSDSEAYCMTALESATLGTPLLVTKIPSFIEMGLNETNAVYFDFDMSNVDECIDKMLIKREFSFNPPQEKWGELLAKGKKEEVKQMKLFRVKATDKFAVYNVVESTNGIKYMEGEEFTVPETRIATLCGDNPFKCAFVEVIGEVKEAEEKPKEEKPKKTKKK